jgi:hypothetical protein
VFQGLLEFGVGAGMLRRPGMVMMTRLELDGLRLMPKSILSAADFGL